MKTKEIPNIKYLEATVKFKWLTKEDIGEDYDFQDAYFDLMGRETFYSQIKMLNTTEEIKTKEDLEKFCETMAQAFAHAIKRRLLGEVNDK